MYNSAWQRFHPLLYTDRSSRNVGIPTRHTSTCIGLPRRLVHNCRIRPICARCTRGPLRKDLRTESRPFHLHLSHEAERDACHYARFAPDTDHRSRFTLTDNGRHPKTMRVHGGKCHEMSKTWVLAGSWHEIFDLSHCLKQRIPNTR